MKRNFGTLDGMRGLAALLIVARHTPTFFGGLIGSESFLAVDLFFGLSGFVMAHAYGDKLGAGLSSGRFLLLRIARLYPLYIVGLVLGVGAALMAGDDKLTAIVLTAGVMVFFLIGPAGGATLNAPCWSLFFELVANIVMATFWSVLSNRVLVAVALIAALALGAGVAVQGTADVVDGWPWIGFSRVGYSYFVGILIYRLRDRVRLHLSPWLVLAIEAGVLAYSPFGRYRELYDLAWILLGFPALIAVAVQREPVLGPSVFRFLGGVSYAVYVLHFPLRRAAAGFVKTVTQKDVSAFAPWIGLGFVGAVLAVSWVLDRYYDKPARDWLRRLFERSGPMYPVVGHRPS